MAEITQKKWTALEQTPQRGSLLQRVLQARGLQTEAERLAFLDCSLASLQDPFRLPGIKAAAYRLAQAVRQGERILIHGDFDADGLTATALMARLLRSFGAEVECIIPDRLSDGYGISVPAVRRAASEKPAALLLTVDCGISAAAEIAEINELGLEVIVTDHHECPAALPQALAVVNPRLEGNPDSEQQLAGVGVAYKLAQALCIELGAPGREQQGLAFVAVGTVADVMPLAGENRILTANGLQALNQGKLVCFKALLTACVNGNRPVTATTISFALAPRLNAAGRLGKAELALELLLTDDPVEANRIALELNNLNEERKTIETEIFAQAAEEIENSPATAVAGPLVVAGEGWHHGVIGIVASRLVERYSRPVIVLAGDEGTYRGSGRSVGNFNLLAAVKAAGEFTERFGGHRQAIGLTLSETQLPGFRLQLQSYSKANAESIADASLKTPTADLFVQSAELTLAAARELEQLQPYGAANPEPLFIAEGLRILESRPVGSNGRTLKLRFEAPTDNGNIVIEGVGFGMGEQAADYQRNACFDAVFNLDVNRFNGRESCQLKVHDLQPGNIAKTQPIPKGGE